MPFKYSLRIFWIVSICILYCLHSYSQNQLKSIDSTKQIAKKINFIRNDGQIRSPNGSERKDIRYTCQQGNLQFILKSNGVSYQLSEVTNSSMGDDSNLYHDNSVQKIMSIISRVDLKWLSCNSEIEIVPELRSYSYTNYYGHHYEEGIENVPSFNAITYKNVWDGIDVKWYVKNKNIEYDFIIQPNADVSKIKWQIEGAQDIVVNQNGELEITTASGTIIEQKPSAFQNGQEIEINWSILNNIVSFEIPEFNPDLAMIIDPVVSSLEMGTYYGGNDYEIAEQMAIDDTSNIYLIGTTRSPSLIATSGSFQDSLFVFSTSFLAKFNEDGILRWGTYYSGNKGATFEDLALDHDNEINLAGYTASDSGIATPGVQQDTFIPNPPFTTVNALIVKFTNAGYRIWASYFSGPNGGTDSRGCDVDKNKNIYIVGSSSSTGIATPSAHQTSLQGASDAMIAKFDSTGNLLWSTYYGGSSPYERFFKCTVDDSSNLYMVGETNSSNLISSPGAFQQTIGGINDGLIVKMDPNGNRIWSTYWGGSNEDRLFNISMNNSNEIIVCGDSRSTGMGSVGAHREFSNNTYDGILGKFSSNGSRIWSTYYGGSGSDIFYGVDIDKLGNILVAGQTASDTGVATPNNHQSTKLGSADAMIVKFNSSGQRLWGTYLGGTSNEGARDCQTNNNDKVIVTGYTNSSTDMTTPGTHQTTYQGTTDAFIARFGECLTTEDTIPAHACDTFITATNKILTVSGTYTDTLTNAGGCDSLLTYLLTITATPTVTSTTLGSRCDTGSVKLLGMASDGNLNWYDSLTGGTYLGTADTFFTPIIDTTTFFYVEAVDSGCVSTTRSQVKATIYYRPNFTSISDGSTCDSGVVNLSATSDRGTISWFDVPFGGTQLLLGNNFSTPKLYNTKTYYVKRNYFLCPDTTRVPVIARVITSPVIDSVLDNRTCDTGSVMITAFPSSGKIMWFNNITGGPALDSGNTYITSNLNSTQTYYATAVDSGCPSLPRTVVNAFVDTTPSFTQIIPDFVCGSGSAKLYALTTSGVIGWYDANSGGNLLGNGNSFTTPLIVEDTAFYVQVSDSFCISERQRIIVERRLNTSSSLSDTACKSYISPSGNHTWTTSGFKLDTIPNNVGCDSVLQITLQINNADTSVSLFGSSLTSNATSGVLQWINCDGLTPIPGATNKVFYAQSKGNYALIIEQNGCLDTSKCFNINNVGISENSDNFILLYPNPNTGEFTIEFEKSITGKIEIFNSVGQVIHSTQINNSQKITLDITSQPEGTYTLKLEYNQGVKSVRVLVVK